MFDGDPTKTSKNDSTQSDDSKTMSELSQRLAAVNLNVLSEAELLKEASKYLHGQGVPKDTARAFPYWKILADDYKMTDALFNVATMYDEGDGIGKDKEKARDYYLLAANQGDYQARYNLGLMLRQGDGIPKNDKQAFEHFMLCATRANDPGAQHRVAEYYIHGKAGSKDLKNAFKYLALAANQGDGEAQFKLACIYASDNASDYGVSKSETTAYHWCHTAFLQGATPPGAMEEFAKLIFRMQNSAASANKTKPNTLK